MSLGSDLLGFGISPAADRQARYRRRERADATAAPPDAHLNYCTSSCARPAMARTIASGPNCGRGARGRPPLGIGQSSGPSSPPGCLCSGININKRPRAPPYFCGRRDARGIVRAIRIWPLAAATGYLEAVS